MVGSDPTILIPAGFPGIISGIEAEEWEDDKLEASEDEEANTNDDDGTACSNNQEQVVLLLVGGTEVAIIL